MPEEFRRFANIADLLRRPNMKEVPVEISGSVEQVRQIGRMHEAIMQDDSGSTKLIVRDPEVLDLLRIGCVFGMYISVQGTVDHTSPYSIYASGAKAGRYATKTYDEIGIVNQQPGMEN